MGLPLFLTTLRIALSPLFPILYLYSNLSLPWLAAVLIFLLAICEGSDYLDGIIARRRNQVTDLGKVLDPMADAVVHLSLFLTFTQEPFKIPILLLLLFIYRECLVATLRTLAALRGVALAARASGKFKTFLQAVVSFLILALLIPYSTGHLSLAVFQAVCFYSLLIAALFSLLSAVDYLRSRHHPSI